MAIVFFFFFTLHADKTEKSDDKSFYGILIDFLCVMFSVLRNNVGKGARNVETERQEANAHNQTHYILSPRIYSLLVLKPA